MNPDAIRYYLKWLGRRFSPLPLYFTLLAIALSFFVVLSIYLRARIGDWSMNGTIAISAGMTLIAGSLLVVAVRVGATVGAWSLLESLEAGYQAGHFREVWRALMIKYRGLHPEIIGGEQFHRLFVAVGSDIVAHEELTVEQARWMDELLTVAKANLATQGGVTVSTSKARFAKPLMIACLVATILSALIKFLGTSH